MITGFGCLVLPEIEAERLVSRAKTNPNILELYLSGRNPPLLSLWAVIPEWDHDTEVNVSETMAEIIAENTDVSLDTLVIASTDRDSLLPHDAQRIYGK